MTSVERSSFNELRTPTQAQGCLTAPAPPPVMTSCGTCFSHHFLSHPGYHLSGAFLKLPGLSCRLPHMSITQTTLKGESVFHLYLPQERHYGS